MRTVKLYGRLAKKFGAEHSFDAGSPAELIRALVANFPGFEAMFSKGKWSLFAGDPTKAEACRPIRISDVAFPVSKREKTLHLFPSSYKVAGLDPITQGFVYVGLSLLTAVIVMVAFAPKIPGPDPNEREKEDKNSFVFDGPVNVTEQGHPVPLVYGRVRTGSIVVSSSITNARVVPGSVWDDGLGPEYDVGETDGLVGKPIKDWYMAYVSKGQKTSTRAAVEDPNTLQSQATGRVVDVVSEGEIGGLVDGLKSVYFDDTPVQNADGSYNFKGVDITRRMGLPDQPSMPGFPNQETSTSVAQNVTIVSGPVTRTITNANIDRARVTIRIPALYKTNTSTGDMSANTVTFKISLQANGGGYQDVLTHTFNDKCTAPYDEDFEFPLTGSAPWNIRITRISPDSASSSERNETTFQTLTEIIDAKFTYPDTALFGLTVDARQFGSTIPNRSYLIDGIKVQIPSNYNASTRVYSGVWNGTFNRAVSSNPAWVAYDICTNNRYGLGRLLGAMPDKFELYTIAQYCDELVPDGFGGQQPRFQLNGVINTRGQALAILRQVCDAFNAMLYSNTTKLKIIQDSPTSMTKTITGANTIEGQIEYAGTPNDGLYSAWVVAFNDPDDGYRLGYQVVEDAELLASIGWKPQEVTRFMCTNRGEAARYGRKLRDDQKYKRHIAKWGAGPDHGFVGPGNIIEAVDKKFTTERWGGLIVSATTTSITIDKAIPIVSGRTYTVKVTLPDGTLATRTLNNAVTAGTTVLTWSSAITLPRKGAIWTVNNDLVSHRLFRVRGATERRFSEYEYTAELYDPNKFARIELGLTIEPANFIDLPTGRIEPPTSITLTEFLKQDGNSQVPCVQVAFPASTDPRAVGYDVAYRDNDTATWTPLYGGGELWREVVNVIGGVYDFRVRAKDANGQVGPWFLLDDAILYGPDTAAGLPAIAGLNLFTDGVNAVFDLRWTKPVDPRPFYYEIFRNTTNTWATATKIGQATEERYPINLSGYYWVRTRYMAAVGPQGSALNVSSASYLNLRTDIDSLIGQIGYAPGIPPVNTLPVSGTENEIVFLTSDSKLYVWKSGAWVSIVADTSGGATGIEVFATNPTTDNFEGRTIFNSTDKKLYVYEGGVFKASVSSGSTGGPIGIEQGSTLPSTGNFAGRLYLLTTDNQLYRYTGSAWINTISGGQIVDASLTAAKFTNTARPLEVVATLPSTGNFEGRMAYLTTDDKIYRHDGSAWTSATAAVDITGQITTTQITNNAITTGKIAAGAITTTELAALSVTAAKIVSATITSTQIAANTIVAGNIAAGTITAAEIAAGTITAAKIAAATITGDRIVGGTITGALIAASTITGGNIAGNTITGDKIIAGQITASHISVSSLSALSANLGSITGGSLNINSRFIVDSSGNVTITGGPGGWARLTISNSVILVYDASNVLRVRLGLW